MNLPGSVLVKIFNYILKYYRSTGSEGYRLYLMSKLFLISKQFSGDVIKKLDYPVLEIPRDQALVEKLNECGAHPRVSVLTDENYGIKTENSVYYKGGGVLRKTKPMYFSELVELKYTIYDDDSLYKLVKMCKGLKKLSIQGSDEYLTSVIDADRLLDSARSLERSSVSLSIDSCMAVNFESFSKFINLKSLDLFQLGIECQESLRKFMRNLPSTLLELSLNQPEFDSNQISLSNIFNDLIESNDRVRLERLTFQTKYLRRNSIYNWVVDLTNVIALLNVNKTIKYLAYDYHNEPNIPYMDIKNQTLEEWRCGSNIPYHLWKTPSSLKNARLSLSPLTIINQISALISQHSESIESVQTENLRIDTEPAFIDLIRSNLLMLSKLTMSGPRGFYFSNILESLSANNTLTKLTLFHQSFDMKDLIKFLKLKHPTITSLNVELPEIDFLKLEKPLIESTLKTFSCYSTHRVHLSIDEYVNFLSRLFKSNKTLERYESKMPKFKNNQPEKTRQIIDIPPYQFQLKPETIKAFKESIKSNNTIKVIANHDTIFDLLYQNDILD